MASAYKQGVRGPHYINGIYKLDKKEIFITKGAFALGTLRDKLKNFQDI